MGSEDTDTGLAAHTGHSRSHNTAMKDTASQSFLYSWMCWRRNSSYEIGLQEEVVKVELVEMVDLPMGLSSIPYSADVNIEKLNPRPSSPSLSSQSSSSLPSYSELVAEIGVC